ncbi:M56 family metallopeptidase [Streptomyces sp. NPDC007162]|uniref:M56 family metallopeptidase n=1 Tax=Streptomyces sp. NPDC007162 TaxID=3156917 RepID=UPI00340CE85A
MIALLILPLLVPFALPALSRRALERLAPAVALWAVAVSAVALASCALAALGAFVLTGLLKLPFFASLGELIRPLHTASDRFVLPLAALSVGGLAVSAWTLVRSALRQTRAFRAARTEAGRGPAAGDLCVVDSPCPDAYALPGRPHRIVVTTGMLRNLDGGEREALFAHERAHNAGGHHYFLAAAEFAAHCHPALRRVRDVIRLAVERVADEAAARAVGDRRLTARAIARAALAGQGDGGVARPAFVPGVASGPVPRRVHALLAAPRRERRAGAWIALLLAGSAGLSCGASVTGMVDFHHRVEVAQGEAEK